MQGMGAPERMLTYYTGVNSSGEIHDTVFAANSGPYSCMVPTTQTVCRNNQMQSQLKLSVVVSSQSAACSPAFQLSCALVPTQPNQSWPAATCKLLEYTQALLCYICC